MTSIYGAQCNDARGGQEIIAGMQQTVSKNAFVGLNGGK